MKQLRFDFSSINQSNNDEDYKIIDKGQNKICGWLDSLRDDGKKISYNEYTYDTPQSLDFENWIYIEKKGLDRLLFKQLYTYLKSINKRSDRLEKLKKVLNVMEIPFDEGDWQTLS